MNPYLLLAMRYRKQLIGAAIVAAVIGVAWYIHDDGRRQAIDGIKTQTVKVERQVQSEKDRIRNNRPDRTAVVDSLRNGAF